MPSVWEAAVCLFLVSCVLLNKLLCCYGFKMGRIENRREFYVCLWRIVTLLSGTRCSQLHIMNTNQPTTRLTGQLLPPEAEPSSASDLRVSLPPSLPHSLCVSLPLSACALHLYCRCLSCVRWCQVDLFSPRRSGCRPSRPLRAAAGSPPQLQLRSAGRATFVGVVFTHRFPIWRKSRACRGSLCAASISFLFLFCLLKSKLQVVPCKFTWLWFSRMECRVSWATSLSEDLKSWRAQVLIYICCAGLKERRLCVFRERSSFEGSPNEMIRQWVNTWRWDGDWETCEMLHVAAVSAGCL